MPDVHETLDTQERMFSVKFQDQSTIPHKVTWHAYVDFHWQEDGGPAVWPSHIIDDRRCHWGGTGGILRQVSVVLGGQEYVQPNLTKAYSAQNSNEGSSFVLTALRPENCNDSQQRRDSDFQNLRNELNGKLPQLVASDFPQVQEQIRQSGTVVEIKAAGASA